MQEEKAIQEKSSTNATNKVQELAQGNLKKFMDYYIAGDEKNIRHYMTEAFENEFNFNELSADQRAFSEPKS